MREFVSEIRLVREEGARAAAMCVVQVTRVREFVSEIRFEAEECA